MKNTTHATCAAVLGLLAGMSGTRSIIVRTRQSKTNCAQCGDEIPPGKAGRKCEKCREEKK